VKTVLPFIVILLGLAQLATAVAIVRTVDQMLMTAAEAAAPLVGPPAHLGKSTLDAAQATRFTILGVTVAVLGAGSLIVGAQLLVLRMIDTRAMKSRLGTDPRA
jgi:hypothetical protein